MSKSIFVRAGFPFNYDVDQASVLSGLECKDKSLTRQSEAQDADINVIVKRFNVTGQLPQGLRLPTYADFDGIFDFRTAMDAVRAAEAAFLQVPAEIRARFGNDPHLFVQFCSNPENLGELRKLGLAPEAPNPDADLEKEADREAKKADLVEKKRAKSKPEKSGGDAG